MDNGVGEAVVVEDIDMSDDELNSQVSNNGRLLLILLRFLCWSVLRPKLVTAQGEMSTILSSKIKWFNNYVQDLSFLCFLLVEMSCQKSFI